MRYDRSNNIMGEKIAGLVSDTKVSSWINRSSDLSSKGSFVSNLLTIVSDLDATKK